MRDWNGKFELVNPREVVIDHRYQRVEKPDLIAAIARNPKWPAFGTLICSRRNNVLYCLDGQQRLRGVLASDEPPRTVPAVVYEVSTSEEEAAIFTDINEYRKAMAAIEKYKARLHSKDPSHVRINNAVERIGFTVGINAGSPRSIAAVGSLRHIYDSAGEDGIGLILVAIRDAWPDELSATNSQILRALGDIVAERNANGGIDRSKLTAALRKTTPARILRKAEELHFDMGCSKRDGVRRAFKALAKL